MRYCVGVAEVIVIKVVFSLFTRTWNMNLDGKNYPLAQIHTCAVMWPIIDIDFFPEDVVAFLGD